MNNNDSWYENKKRFKIRKGYIFDKRIFQITILFLIIIFLIIVFVNGSKSRYYYACDSPIGCDIEPMKEFCNEPSKLNNIKYPGRYEWLQNCGLCNGGVVPDGFTCGEKTGFLQGSEYFITIIVILLCFLINHLIYNRKYDFGGLK